MRMEHDWRQFWVRDGEYGSRDVRVCQDEGCDASQIWADGAWRDG